MAAASLSALATAVATAAAQKVLNSHVQQIGGLSSLQVMHHAFPAMSLLSIAYIPLMDSHLDKLLSMSWLSLPAVVNILASSLAAFCATWSATLIFGMIGALAHVLLGQVKTCTVLLLAAMLYDARPTTEGVTGSVLALGAITAYSVLKVQAPTSGGSSKAATGQALNEVKPSGSGVMTDEETPDEGRPLNREYER